MSLAKQGKRKPPNFTAAGNVNTGTDSKPDTEVAPKPSTDVSTEVSTNTSTDKPMDSMEALRLKHAEEMKAKKKAGKKQISTYLEPAVLKAYEKYGHSKGDKQKLINDLLKTYFGVEEE